MKFVFFGSPELAQIVLERMCRHGAIPAAVVCSPDRPAGRHGTLKACAVKRYLASEHPEVLLLQPEDPSDSVARLQEINADIFVVAAYAKILPASIVEMPRLGTMGVHPSLLPKWRGASPIQSAILNGDMTTGVSLYLLDAKMDHGPVVAQSSYEVKGTEDYEVLEAKLAYMGGELLSSILPSIDDAVLRAKDQDHSLATFTKKFQTADAQILEEDLGKALAGDEKAAIKAYRMIRAFSREPVAWALVSSLDIGSIKIRNKRIKLLSAKIEDGALKISRLQIEGKTPIDLY